MLGDSNAERDARDAPDAKRVAGRLGTEDMSQTTPCVFRCTHANSASNMLVPMEDITDERMVEAVLCVQRHLVQDIDGVFEAAQPLSTVRRRLAKEIAQLVRTDLEAFIRSAGPSGSRPGRGRTLPTTAAEQKDSVARLAQRPARSAAEKAPQPPSRHAPPAMGARRSARAAPSAGQSAAPPPAEPTSRNNDLVGWVTMVNTGSDDQCERDMYPGINSFVNFVADRASVHMSGRYTGQARSVRPFDKTDTTPVGADDQPRVDHMLTGRPRAGPIARPDYGAALCLIEAKFNTDIYYQMQAYMQMAMYSRNIYASQPHRRFLWGLTVCGTRVRACLLGNDGIYASKYADVSTPAGRGQFAELLVSWSLCESAHLGYDSMMRPTRNSGGWKIAVFGNGMKRTYSNLVPTFCTSSLLGRHTRCFTGTAEIGGSSKELLIRDCWPHIVEDGTDGNRDEITFLREIRDKLRGNSDLDGKYPAQAMGGVVQIAGRDGSEIGETTTAVVADLDLAANAPLRAHTRIVMSPVGKPLQTARLPDELIIVTCNAMEVHTAPAEQRQILHRDILIYNIRVCRSDDKVGGILIDLDNAIHMTGDHVAARTSRMGTPPFMSFGNLAANSVKRTALDDWESVIYILCLRGTLGVNIRDQMDYRRDICMSEKWWNGSLTDIAETKWFKVDTPGAFSSAVLELFIRYEQYSWLWHLAKDLHKMLFCNPRASLLCHGSYVDEETRMKLQNGTLPIYGFYDAGVDLSIKNPYVRRAEIADLIVKDLMDTCVKACRTTWEWIRYEAV